MSIFERMVKEFEAGNYEVVIALAKDVLDKSPSHDMAWRAMRASMNLNGLVPHHDVV
jgi:hypothetical protein